MKQAVFAFVILLFFAADGVAQAQPEISDSAVVARFKEEGLQNSQVMELLSYLCDVYGPRLAWSPEYKRSADWASNKMREWGLQNIYYDYWAPLGKGWSVEDFSSMVTAPVHFPVIAYPLAWSPRIREKEADVVFLNVKKMEDFDAYKGKLKGKFVLMSDPMEVQTRFEPAARRLADSILLRMANADLQGGRRGGRRGPGFFPNATPQNIDSIVTAARQRDPNMDAEAFRQRLQQQIANLHKLQFVQDEGALAAITTSRGDGGNLIVQSATVPQPEGAPFNQRLFPYDPKAPDIIPQVVFAAEHYNRIIRMLKKGERVKLEMKLDVATTKADSGFNIIAEIPGTDLKDEIVMLGGHFDSWHGGTGATDDGSGTAASMEAMRILKTLAQKYGMTTRRTVRIGLWGAEEEGLIGSREYVSQYYARREGATGAQGFGGGGGTLVTTPDYEKLYVYLNHDNGTGRIRGIYLQGNEAARPIFRSWFTEYGDPTAQTITIQNTGGTDHQSFDGVGLPGFQFIQDPIDYDSRTHHYIMDVYERLQPEDMKQAATIMALFAYNAANREGKFPRKPMQQAGSARAGF